MTGFEALRGVVAALVDLVLPRACAGCGLPGLSVCAGCRAFLAEGAFLLDGGRHTAEPSMCGAAVPYEDPARSMVIAFKERARLDLTAVLADALALAVAEVVRARDGPVALVPVPSSDAARRARGYDHVGLLARRCAVSLRARGQPTLVAPVLRSARRVADQSGLGAAQRATNVMGAFAVRDARLLVSPRSPVTVVIVDDVMTTGATLAEAAATLRAAGLDAHGCAVVAATPLRAVAT